MRKAELEKIPVEKIKNNIMFQNIEVDIRYLLSAKTFTDVTRTRILVVNFFDKSDLKLKFRLFLNKKAEDYITAFYNENNEITWKTGALNNLLWRWAKDSLLIDNKSISSILKYFKVDKDALKSIDTFQNNILEKKRLKRHQKELDWINSYMNTVPKVPRNFKKWIEETALIDSRYIYYKYNRTKKTIKGYCTHCGQEVLITNPKHNKKGICPNCKSNITFKSKGMLKRLEDKVTCCLIQRITDSSKRLLIRLFEIEKVYYSSNYTHPKLYISELIRTFQEDDGSEKDFEFSYSDSFHLTAWHKNLRGGMSCHNYDFYHIALYNKNLTKVLKGTRYEYSQIEKFATQKPGLKFPVYAYLYRYNMLPFLEYIFKEGLINLFCSILSYSGTKSYLYEYFNLKGKRLVDILKLDKNAFRQLKDIDANLTQLKVLQQHVRLSNEQIQFIAHAFSEHDFETFFSLSKFSSVNKTVKYISKQANILKAVAPHSGYLYKNHNYENDVLIEWNDYIEKCKSLKYDLKNDFVLFPKDLKKRHDDICIEYKDKSMDIFNEQINERFESLSKLYDWEDDNFIILVADSADALVHEGHALHHCVGGYKENMAKGKTCIVFLRKKSEPQKPFFTIEIVKNEIRQIRGFDDCPPTAEVSKAVDKFKKQKLQKISYSKELPKAV